MKTCSIVKKHLPLFVDDELSTTDRKEVEAHVRMCSDCANELEDMQIMQQMFRYADKYRAPFGFTERVLAEAVSQHKQKSVFIPCFAKVAEAFVLMIIIAVGIASGNFLMQGQPSQKSDSLATIFSLDIFETAPPGSIGDAYLAVEGSDYEK